MSADPESRQLPKVNVAAVLVNWRQPHRTIEVAQALARQTVRPIVVVVDNGSGDDSVNQLRSALPGEILVTRDSNGGFGAGSNAGIELANSMDVDYVWLINNDAVPEEDCLQHLLARACSDAEIGVVGACIREPNGTIVDHAGCVMNPFSLNCRYTLSETEIARSRYAWITGASMLLATSALKKVGLFDVGYFMYWEDADLCHRLRRAGFKIAISEQALVCHEAGTSSNDMRLNRYQWHIDSQSRWVILNYSNKFYGLFLVYFRHFIKCIISCDGARFLMTAKSLKKFINSNNF